MELVNVPLGKKKSDNIDFIFIIYKRLRRNMILTKQEKKIAKNKIYLLILNFINLYLRLEFYQEYINENINNKLQLF